ncbi:MAG TPA: hypothetical protein VEC11_00170 [Allosphingosinicella sp.]|nr:hypothetical protein [Allosphingosinicella sp.]
MRRLPFLALVLLAAATPAAAQLGFGPPPQEVARLVERARDLPLGSAQNPVRVNMPAGEHAYIARLRCADGTRPRVGQRSNIGVGAFGTIVDRWPLDCGDAAPGRFDLHLDMYHPNHVESRAPAGFSLIPDGNDDGDDEDGGKPAAPADPTV